MAISPVIVVSKLREIGQPLTARHISNPIDPFSDSPGPETSDALYIDGDPWWLDGVESWPDSIRKDQGKLVN